MNNHRFVVGCYVLILLSRCSDSIKFDQNGYEDVIVKISDSMTEENVIKIKNSFTEASNLLYKATNRKAYFGQVTLLFPNENYLPLPFNLDITNATWETLEKPTFTVSTLVDDISTRQNAFCGEVNDGVILPKKLIEDVLGPRKIAQSWAKYRYGVFDESPLVLETGACYYERASWKLTGCYNEDHNDSLQVFVQDDGTVKCPDISANDLFRDINVKSSLMFSESVPSIEHFCDDVTYPHNVYAPTKQNFYCDGKSVGSVIESSPDFDGVGGTIATSSTRFKLVTIQAPRVVLAIQNAISVTRQNHINNVLEFFNAFFFDDQTEIGVVSFGDKVEVKRQLSAISPNTKLLDNLYWLKPIPGFKPCPTCALREATKMLETSERTNVIILIGDVTVLNTVVDVPNVIENAKLLVLPFMGESQVEEYENLISIVDSSDDVYPLVEIENDQAIVLTKERFYFSLMDILNRISGSRQILLVHKRRSALKNEIIMEGTFATASRLDGNLLLEVFCDGPPSKFSASLNNESLANTDLADSAIIKKQLSPVQAGNIIWKYSVKTKYESHCSAFAFVVGKSYYNEVQLPLQTSYHRIQTELNGNSAEYIVLNADLGKFNPGITVEAHLVDQNNYEQIIRLNDDSLDPDLTNNDGLYTNYFVNSNKNVPAYYFTYISATTVSEDSTPIPVLQLEYLGYIRVSAKSSIAGRRINNLKVVSLRRTLNQVTLTWSDHGDRHSSSSDNDSLIEVKYSKRFEDLGENNFENAKPLVVNWTSTANASHYVLEFTVVCKLPEEEENNYYVAVRTRNSDNQVSRVSNRIQIIGEDVFATLTPRPTTPTTALTTETSTSSSETSQPTDVNVTEIPNDCTTIHIINYIPKETLSKTVMIIIICGSLFVFFLLVISGNFLICWRFAKNNRDPPNTLESNGRDNPSMQSTLRVTDTQNQLVFDGHSPVQRDFAHEDGTMVAVNPIYESSGNYSRYFNRHNNRSEHSIDLGRV